MPFEPPRGEKKKKGRKKEKNRLNQPYMIQRFA
jgi:hypothetical protein